MAYVSTNVVKAQIYAIYFKVTFPGIEDSILPVCVGFQIPKNSYLCSSKI